MYSPRHYCVSAGQRRNAPSFLTAASSFQASELLRSASDACFHEIDLNRLFAEPWTQPALLYLAFA